MVKKFICNQNSSSSSNCNSSSSSVYCCAKYPKCKCAPIYYPNNQYPCNPYPNNLYRYNTPYNGYYPNPCNQYPPPCPPACPPPCPAPPNTCGNLYTSNNTLIASSTTFTASTPNVNICNITASITITLPSIPNQLSCCLYNKMFIISNLSTSTASQTVSVVPTGDTITSTVILAPGETVTLYSVYISTGSYWIAI